MNTLSRPAKPQSEKRPALSEGQTSQMRSIPESGATTDTASNLLTLAVSVCNGAATKAGQTSVRKRRSSFKRPRPPQAKRQKQCQPVPDSHLTKKTLPLDEQSERDVEKILMSMIQKKEGVFELIPRLDTEYSAHADNYFPQAQRRVDAKVLMYILDNLEQRGELVRIMLSSVTPIGNTQYKSILILPEIDPITNLNVKRLQDDLQQEAAAYTPASVVGLLPQRSSAFDPAPTTTELHQNLRTPANAIPIPPHILAKPVARTQTPSKSRTVQRNPDSKPNKAMSTGVKSTSEGLFPLECSES